MEKKNKGLLIASKVIIALAFVFIVTCTIIYFIELDKPEKSFFYLHLALPIILFFVGLIAMLMSYLSKKSITGESKGDHMMMIVGFVLILISFLTLIFSFIM